MTSEGDAAADDGEQPNHEPGWRWRWPFRILVWVLLTLSGVSLLPGWMRPVGCCLCCCVSDKVPSGRPVEDGRLGGRWEIWYPGLIISRAQTVHYDGGDWLGANPIVLFQNSESVEMRPTWRGLVIRVSGGRLDRAPTTVLIDDEMLSALRWRGPWIYGSSPEPRVPWFPMSWYDSVFFLVLAAVAWHLGFIVRIATQNPLPRSGAREPPPLPRWLDITPPRK